MPFIWGAKTFPSGGKAEVLREQHSDPAMTKEKVGLVLGAVILDDPLGYSVTF